ncbi:MAG: cell division protein SepF [Bacilli bacterium]|nr:cell division protein SepF [Bacilli bacterium]MBN2697074.1 cell division protein SepF [Bacilli bacterium]
MGLFKKSNTTPTTDVDFEDLKFYRVHDSSGIYDYAEMIMHRLPIVLNLSDCLITEANEVLLFLSGVLYACDGEVVKIQDKIYLMAQKSDLNGPTLQKFIHDYTKK